MPSHWQRATVIATVLVTGSALTVVATQVMDGEELKQWVGVTSLVSSLAGLAVAMAGTAAHVSRRHVRLRTAPAELAQALREQWQAEWRLRRLQDPWPLRVRWSAADPLLSDHASNVGCGGRRLAGEFDHIAELFERLPKRRLVVLGAPGAGKTVLALRLTLDLLDNRADDRPVPVIFPLSTWQPEQCGVQEWMTNRLVLDHGALGAEVRRGVTIADELLTTGKILPVLDGLDEIPEPLRGEAVRRLNSELDAGIPVLLTCRTEIFAATVGASDVLTTAAVIELLPLSLDEIRRYLHATTRLPATKWDAVLGFLDKQPTQPVAQALRDTLSVPLMAAMARSIYSDTKANPSELLDSRFADRAVVEEHLLDAFIPAAFARRPSRPGVSASPRWTAEQARRWLGFLAEQCQRRGGRDIAWWNLPRALPPAARLVPASLLAGVLLLSVWCMLYPVLRVSWSLVAIALYLAGLGIGLIALPMPRIRAVVALGATTGLLIGLTQKLGEPSLDFGLGGPGPLLTVLPLRPNERYFANLLVYGLVSALLLGAAGIGRRPPRPLTIPVRLLGGRHVPADKTSQLLDLARTARRGLTPGLANGIGFGIAGGLCCGTAAGLRGAASDQAFAILFLDTMKLWSSGGLILGLISGLVGALYRCSERSADTARAASPCSSLRSDRYAAFGRGLLALLFIWPLILLVEGMARLGLINEITGADMVILLSIPMGPLVISLASWGRFLGARLWLCGLGLLPWRLMSFLAEAHERGVLRQVGAVYEFRHIRLQERLASPRQNAESTGDHADTPVCV